MATKEELEKLMRDIVTHFTVSQNPFGPIGAYGTLLLSHHPAPGYSYGFCAAHNSYDEAALGELSSMLSAGRRMLEMEPMDAEPRAFHVTNEEGALGVAKK